MLLSLSMAQFMVVPDFTIVNVALPFIQRKLHVAATTLQWLVSAYAVAFGGFLLLGGGSPTSTAGPGCTGSAWSRSSRRASPGVWPSSRVVPPGPPHPSTPQPHHLFRHHAGGIP